MAALVEAVAGSAPSDELAHTVHEMTEGNPFFVFELARLLGEAGGLAARPSALALPQSVRDAIGRRLDALSADATSCCAPPRCSAAPSTSRSSRASPGARPEELLDRLGEALAAGVLVEHEERVGHYAFAHALVRQTLYEELRAPQRVRLHRRAAEALEAAFAASDEPPLSEIAHHCFEAAPGGAAEQAIAAAERAAERAHQLLAYEESARLYEQALEALAIAAPEDAERRFELLAAAGTEHAAAGARESARARFRTAAGIARGLGRADLLARAALGYRGFGEMGIPPDADTLALLEEARDALGGARSGAALAPALEAHRHAALHALDGEARRALEEALELARASGDRVALRDALGARHWACLGPDRVAERIAVGEEMVSLGEAQRRSVDGLHRPRGAVRRTPPAAATRQGADRALAECVRLAGALRYRFVLFQARFFEGARAACSGDLDGAERIFADALELGRDRVPYAQVISDAHSLWMRFQRGDREGLGEGVALLEGSVAPLAGEPEHHACHARARSRSTKAAATTRAACSRRSRSPISKSLERDEHFLLTDRAS